MKNKNYIAFAKGLVLFFAISHGLSYIISTLQTALIITEIRKIKAGQTKKRATKENAN